MKIGIIIYTTDAETAWNAFRLGIYSLKQGDAAKAFLVAKGVECEAIHSQQFPVKDQMQAFAGAGGEILACGTCLKLRQSEGTDLCPVSTMKELYEIVRDSDRVVSF